MHKIKYTNKDPYFEWIDPLYQKQDWNFPPWTTVDPDLLTLVSTHFPEIKIIPPDLLISPRLTPVEILPLSNEEFVLEDQEDYFLSVGGPPAAIVAMQHAINKNNVLYVNDNDVVQNKKMFRPIWAGAGNHGEPDALTEAPGYTFGYQPFTFILSELFRSLCMPQKNFFDPDYPWLHLNIKAWLKSPREWLSALRVAFGNQRLAQRYHHSLKHHARSEIHTTLQNRTHKSAEYLIELNNKLSHELLRAPRGSLIIAPTDIQWKMLLQHRELLADEGLFLNPITNEEAQTKYGICPRNAVGLMEKTHDFMFNANFNNTILQQIQLHGGHVKTNWRLSKIYVHPDNTGSGIAEFYEWTSSNTKKIHYKKFKSAHLSLGATGYEPKQYDLISITGVSINALLIGTALSGGPIVCGGTNHIVPLYPPIKLDIFDPQSGKTSAQEVTLVRLSAAASVNPLNRGKEWYHYDGRQALHLLRRVRDTLPAHINIKLLSVYGCNRVIGKDGHQVELHPVIKINGKKTSCNTVTIQIGAGGGGLTQMGFIPSLIKQNR